MVTTGIGEEFGVEGSYLRKDAPFVFLNRDI